MVSGWQWLTNNKVLPFYTGTRSLSRYYVGNAYQTGGPTVKFMNMCTLQPKTVSLVNMLIHGY